jgi:hypothetical protein
MAITETIRGKARIVIRYKSTESKEKPFTTRRISVPENELGDCNLAVFGQPRHPLFENKSVVHELSCDFLSFKFTSTKRMDNFVAHFKFALDNECKRVENIQLADSEAKRQANQPKYAASTRRNSSTERLFGSGKGNLNSKTSTILGSSPPRFRNDPLNKSFRPFSGLGLEKMSEASEFEKL